MTEILRCLWQERKFYNKVINKKENLYTLYVIKANKSYHKAEGTGKSTSGFVSLRNPQNSIWSTLAHCGTRWTMRQVEMYGHYGPREICITPVVPGRTICFQEAGCLA